MLALDEPDALPKDGSLRGATMRTAMGTYHLRPFGQPCIEGFFGGRFARELEDAGEGAFAAHSIDEIAALLGNEYRRKLKPLSESRWAHDPFARGSYSHALPGHAGMRAVLAAPVDGRLFFAGEATSPNFFSTAHGARDSGETGGRGGAGAMHSPVTTPVIAMKFQIMLHFDKEFGLWVDRSCGALPFRSQTESSGTCYVGDADFKIIADRNELHRSNFRMRRSGLEPSALRTESWTISMLPAECARPLPRDGLLH